MKLETNNELLLLGMLVRDQGLFRHCVSAGLNEKHFLGDKNKKLFAILEGLEQRELTFDDVTIATIAMEQKVIKTPLELFELIEQTPITANADYFLGRVKENWKLQQYSEAIIEVTHDIKNGETTADKVSARLDQTTLEIGSQETSFLKDAHTLATNFLNKLEERLEGKVDHSISTGYPSLDEKFTFQPNDLVILGGRPGMGKTAFAINVILDAIKSKKKTAIFSLEMSDLQIVERIVSITSRIPAKKMRGTDFSDDDLDRISHGFRKVGEMQDYLFVDDTAGISLEQLRSRCIQLQKTNGLDFVVIDYLQLMTGDDSNNRERELSKISAGLKGLAKTLKIPVLALCQINRGVENRPDKRPRISDIRESGGIEQDADAIMFVYRPAYYKEEKTNDKPTLKAPNGGNENITEIIVGKNRHGELGTVELEFIPHLMQFSEKVS